MGGLRADGLFCGIALLNAVNPIRKWSSMVGIQWLLNGKHWSLLDPNRRE